MDSDFVEVRSEEVGEKRVVCSDDDVEVRSPKKKARNGGELKRVAEIVMVLETMRKMRGGRSPTQVEIELMSEARGKLVEVCQEFAPVDVFPREACGVVMDDLGLSKLKEQFRQPTMQIAEKLKLTQEKMEKAEEFVVHSALYSSQKWQKNVGSAAESRGTSAVRMLSSQKPSEALVKSSSDKPSQTSSSSISPLGHVSTVNSTPLLYQLPTSEVRPVVPSGSPISYIGRDSSSLALARAEKPRSDMTSKSASFTSQVQVNSPGNQSKPLPWSVQPLQSTLSAKNASGSKVAVNAPVKVEGVTNMLRVIPQTTTSKSFTSQSAFVNPPSMRQHIQQGVEIAQPSSMTNKHNDIANIVQNVLEPHLAEQPIWTPPSRDYMNKALACQVCSLITNETDNVLVCDGCEKGYHLKCLKINNQKSVPRGEWHCVKCLSLSNGKALPPKYGRVLRNMVTPPKVTFNATSLSAKTLGPFTGKVDPQRTTGNGKFIIQNAPSGAIKNNSINCALGVEMADKRVMHKAIDEKSSTCDPSDVINTSADSSISSVGLSVETAYEKKLIAQSTSSTSADSGIVKHTISSIDPSKHCPDTNLIVKDLEKSCREGIQDSDANVEVKRDELGTINANHVEILGTSVQSNEHNESLSGGLHNVDWIGNVLNVVDEKTYYQSCLINGVVYKVHDHALFRSNDKILTLSKLQSMWEDNKTKSKWVIASRCYFPADLPKSVGRPFAPDNNEVYESNHDTAIRAGLIDGPCKVLPPRQFIDESQRRTRIGMERGGELPPLFVCKWFFDERKRLFRDVSS